MRGIFHNRTTNDKMYSRKYNCKSLAFDMKTFTIIFCSCWKHREMLTQHIACRTHTNAHMLDAEHIKQKILISSQQRALRVCVCGPSSTSTFLSFPTTIIPRAILFSLFRPQHNSMKIIQCLNWVGELTINKQLKQKLWRHINGCAVISPIRLDYCYCVWCCVSTVDDALRLSFSIYVRLTPKRMVKKSNDCFFPISMCLCRCCTYWLMLC